MSPMAVRSESSRRAVLQATMDLLGDEPPGPVSLQKLSIEGIARRAGVSKMTIYRWWPDKVALVIDSFLDNHVARTPVRQDGPAIASLREHLTSLAAVYAGPEGRLVAQLIAECQYEPKALAEFKHRFWEGRAEAVTALIQRAQAEGDLRSISTRRSWPTCCTRRSTSGCFSSPGRLTPTSLTCSSIPP